MERKMLLMVLEEPGGSHLTNERGQHVGEFMNKAKGKIKQAMGGLTGDKKLKREGEGDELKGRIEGATDDVKDAAKDAKKAIKDAVK